MVLDGTVPVTRIRPGTTENCGEVEGLNIVTMPGQSDGRYDVGNSVEVGSPETQTSGEVMNYFNEFTGVTRWRLVDYPGPLQFANLH